MMANYASCDSYGNYDAYIPKTIRLYTLENAEKMIDRRNKITTNKKIKLVFTS